MKIVFMGTPEFAVPSLAILLEHGLNVIAVVTSPDKPAGRGKKLNESAIKKFALEKGLKIMQPINLKDDNFISELSQLKPDLQIVVAFRMLPERVWNLPKLGTYNLHASLLPYYRGAAPINWAIINGEKKTGISTFKLQHEIDSGNILLQEEQKIEADMNAGMLHDVLMQKGAELLMKTVQFLEENENHPEKIQLKKQEEGIVSHAPKIHKETCRINWNSNALEIHNLVRGLCPYPAAFATYVSSEGVQTIFKIFRTSYIEHKTTNPINNGCFIDEEIHKIEIACAFGTLQIHELQQEGKRRLKTEDFLRGFKGFKSGKFI